MPVHRPRRRRLGLVVTLAVGLLIVPALALATHQFSDVPTGASYHDEVESLVGAGITTGCGGGNYCPSQAVTRGQMAQFLDRGLGMATSSFGTATASEAELFFVATIAIPAGSISGGTGYVNVSADVSTIVPLIEGQCPCGVQFIVVNLNQKAISPMGTFVVPEDSLEEIQANTGTVSWVFEAPTGEIAEFGLIAELFPQPVVPLGGPGPEGAVEEPRFDGTMTAEYSPFGFE